MSSQLNRRRTPLGVIAVVFVLTITGCAGSASAAATPKDRAACAQLRPAFTALNAWSGGPIPSQTYRRAIAAARHADNRRLRDAITRWMTTVLGATGSTPGRDATYATEQCRSIGLSLHLRVSSVSTISMPQRPPAVRARVPSTDESHEGDD